MRLPQWIKTGKTKQENRLISDNNNVEAVQRHGLFLVGGTPEPWNEPAALYDIDIVFVHGLGGHFQKTWTHGSDDTKFFWPADSLVKDLPGARIFSYSYPSGGLQITRSKAGIRDFANGLLQGLRSKRQQEQSRSRPLVFISHSLGGIVVKQAIILARSEAIYEPLWSNTKGIIFLGTPHRGSVLADDALLLAVVTNLALGFTMANRRGSMDTSTLELLRKDKQQLNDISSDFLNCLRQQPEIMIISFYETKTMVGLKQLVVNQASAQLGANSESFRQLDADHREICKFFGHDDPNLELVLTGIKDIVQGLDRKPKTRPLSNNSMTESVEGAVKDCVPFLNTVDLSQYTDVSQSRVDGTLRWFDDNPQYLQWKSSLESSILWVSGFAGSGKTTLVLYIKQLLLKEFQRHRIVATFICDDKNEKQRNIIYILQSLIYQIVEQYTGLWRLVITAKKKHGPLHFQRLDGLWQILEQIINSDKSPGITILLDAVDECEVETKQSILGRLYTLSVGSIDASFKVFVTSRLDARSTLNLEGISLHVSDIWLDDYQTQIAEDVSLVVRRALQRLVNMGRCGSNIQNLIADAFIAKADKGFLWTKFALKYLEERNGLLSTTISDIESLLPQALEGVYQKYLSTIPRADVVNAATLLRFLVACDRPLSTAELGILFVADVSQTAVSLVQEETNLIDNRLIVNLLGSLIRIEGDKVYLVHQTLKDFLTALPSTGSLTHSFAVNIDQMKGTIALICVRYIRACIASRPNIEGSTSSSADSDMDIAMDSPTVPEPDLLYGMNLLEAWNSQATDDLALQSHMASFGLFDYAALHLHRDIQIASERYPKDIDLLWDLALELYEYDDTAKHCWFRYLWSHQLPGEPFPAKVDALTKAAFTGHLPVIQRLLMRSNVQRESISRALYWTVRHDHELCTSALLSHANLSDSQPIIEPHPLLIAAKYGSLHCFTMLMKMAPLLTNIKDSSGETALMLAAGHGHVEIVKALLKDQHVDCLLADNLGRTALHRAVYSESVAVTDMLIMDGRVDVRAESLYGRTALIQAAEDGNLEIMKVLLKHSSILINQQDHKGRTALSYACGQGHLSVVKRLWKMPGIDLLCPDKQGRVIHSWAACHRNPETLRFLTSRARQGIDIPDHDGWSPFAWALGPPAITANITLLLETKEVDLNRKDALSGRPLLSWAAGYGETSLIRTLLRDARLDVHAKDDQGHTPLMNAAIAGHADTVSFLVQQSFTDVNQQDLQGRTALWLAARDGHLEIVILLARVPGVQLCLRDNQNLTALEAALKFNHRATSIYLQESIDKQARLAG